MTTLQPHHCTLYNHTVTTACATTVQFKMVCVRSEKPICAPPHLSEVFPTTAKTDIKGTMNEDTRWCNYVENVQIFSFACFVCLFCQYLCIRTTFLLKTTTTTTTYPQDTDTLVCSLPIKSRRSFFLDLTDTYATHASLGDDVKDTKWNCTFTNSKHKFLTNLDYRATEKLLRVI